VTERFDDVVRQYIDFVNQQVGAYMDALAGFAGHYARVERQVHRVNRPVRCGVETMGMCRCETDAIKEGIRIWPK
jgi:hypothetical protein